jgi:predicted nuclease of predicted toxin-antitoxin system
MRIIADENVPRPIVVGLRGAGHDVTSILEVVPRMPDPDILQLAAQEHALLVTCDKDFRQLAIEARRPCAGVVLLRLEAVPLRDRAPIIAQTIQNYGEQLHNFYSIQRPDRLEMEPLP